MVCRCDPKGETSVLPLTGHLPTIPGKGAVTTSLLSGKTHPPGLVPPEGFLIPVGSCPRQPTAPDVELLGWGGVVMPSGVAQLSPLRTGWVCPGLTLGGHTDSSGSLCPRVGHLSSSSGLYLPHTHTQRSFYGEGMDRGRRGKQRCEPSPLLRCMLKGRGG